MDPDYYQANFVVDFHHKHVPTPDPIHLDSDKVPSDSSQRINGLSIGYRYRGKRTP